MYFIFFYILSYDIWFYISHLLLHHPRIYFIHKKHHSKPYSELNYVDTNEGHAIEHVIQPLGILIPCFFKGSSFIQLFIAWSIIGARGLMRHDHRISWVIGNHHLLHHKYPNYNYGEYWIDCLFGTAYPYKKEYIYGKFYV